MNANLGKTARVTNGMLAAGICLGLLVVSAHAEAIDCPVSITGNDNGVELDVSGTGPDAKGCSRVEVKMNHPSGETQMQGATINSDGSRNPQGEDWRVEIKPQEDYARIDSKSGYGQFGGDWPDDEYTRHLPKPGFGVRSALLNKKERSFAAMFEEEAPTAPVLDFEKDATVKKMKNYVEKLKKMGFTVDAKERAHKGGLASVRYGSYKYQAGNRAGYWVDAGCFHSGKEVACNLKLYDPEGARKKAEREKGGRP